MKKLLLYFLTPVCAFILAGCGPKTKWDYPNSNISIIVRDAAGRNLCNPNGSGFDCILPDGITITYNGVEYDLYIPGVSPTRATEPDMPKWTEDGRKPFRWNERSDDGAMLQFGEFSVDTKNYRGETFTIDWGDGTRSEVTFDLYATSNGKKKQPTVHQATWVDGEVNSGTSLIVNIVKD